MKQVLVKQGEAVVIEIPTPIVEEGTVLVKVDHSCISIGTELSGVRASGMPLWRRVAGQPDNVKRVFNMFFQEGFSKTRQLVKGRLSGLQAIGYSAAGTVLEIGAGVDGIYPGDRVACAGAQCAFHAQIIRVPINLVVPIPADVQSDEASTVTLGAIAIQGVRRATPLLGETFVVIGLGVLGQITVQALLANGCRVIGIDVDSERITMAMKLGMQVGIHPDHDEDYQQIARLTDGHGADAVIITAATPSDEVVATAFNICRKKGRVVLVGDVGLNLNRADFYLKEIDFFISTSYGPGRYDNNYEEKGLDYPLAYVRWTENRNMAEYLRLIADGRMEIKPLISAVYSLEDAPLAYGVLKSGTDNPLMVLLSYEGQASTSIVRKVINHKVIESGQKLIRTAVAGAGGFAKLMHLPNLKSLNNSYQLRCIYSRTGHNALDTAAQFGANYSTTDFQEVLNDSDIDAVLITTRHDSHAGMALMALKAGKHVLVEKPMALNKAELEEIEDFYADSSIALKPTLLTGFNRRFAPFMARIKARVDKRTNPMIINYKMNAGYIPLDHWVHSAEGGGRNIGEACHIYDLFTFLTDAKCTSIKATAIRPTTSYYGSNDNFVTVLGFEDGSIATLTYCALGNSNYSKETMEIFCDGEVIELDDYKSLSFISGKTKKSFNSSQNKGQREELITFAECIKSARWAIPFWQQCQSTKISFIIEDQLSEKSTQSVTE